MAFPFSVPLSHIPHLRAIQEVAFSAQPPRPHGQSMFIFRRRWRDAIVSMVTAAIADVQVVPVGVDVAFVIDGVWYKLLSAREDRSIPETSPYLMRLRSNPKKWLYPIRTQVVFPDGDQDALEDPEGGSEELPIPLFFDPDGELWVGYPDFIDPWGAAHGLEATLRVLDLTMVVEPEPTPTVAPPEPIPEVQIPKLKGWK